MSLLSLKWIHQSTFLAVEFQDFNFEIISKMRIPTSFSSCYIYTSYKLILPGIPTELTLPCDAVSSLITLTPEALPILEGFLLASPLPFSPLDGTLIGGRGWLAFNGGDSLSPGIIARAPSLFARAWMLNPELPRLWGDPALAGFPPMNGVLLGVRVLSFSFPKTRWSKQFVVNWNVEKLWMKILNENQHHHTYISQYKETELVMGKFGHNHFNFTSKWNLQD